MVTIPALARPLLVERVDDVDLPAR